MRIQAPPQTNVLPNNSTGKPNGTTSPNPSVLPEGRGLKGLGPRTGSSQLLRGKNVASSKTDQKPVDLLRSCTLALGIFGLCSAAVANTVDQPSATQSKQGQTELGRWLDIPLDNYLNRWNWSPSLYLSLGRSDFKWNIASNGNGNATPNILSELTYRNLQSTHWNIDNVFDYKIDNRWSWTNQLKFSTGVIDAGQIQDSDYDGDHRQGEYSRSYSNPIGSVLRDVTVVSGFKRQINDQWQGSGLVGVSQHQQKFSKIDGEQVVVTQNRTPEMGKFGGLNSTYAADWKSVWVGFGAQWQWQGHLLNCQFEQHLSDYYAEANWNLRSGFAHPKSFDHVAIGRAQVLSMTYQKELNQRLNLLVQWQTENWKTEAGVDTVYYANGGRASTRLNEVKWNSQRLSVGLNLTTW